MSLQYRPLSSVSVLAISLLNTNMRSHEGHPGPSSVEGTRLHNGPRRSIQCHVIPPSINPGPLPIVWVCSCTQPGASKAIHWGSWYHIKAQHGHKLTSHNQVWHASAPFKGAVPSLKRLASRLGC